MFPFRYYCLITGLLFITTSAFSQGTPVYGNEWINDAQEYYHIKVVRNGIYRISFDALSNAGAPAGTINPQNFHLYLNGQEQSLYVQGGADNSFDSSDYIEFFG